MAWTSPRTWVAGETLTAALLNVHLRDNLKAIGDAWVSWTPTITAETGTFTTVSGAGRYTQAGNLIHWSATITITTVGTAADGIRMTLPVTARAANIQLGTGRENTATGHALEVFSFSTTVANIAKYDNTSAIGAGRTIIVGGTYEAA